MDDESLGKLELPLGDVSDLVRRAREVAHAHRMEYLGTESLLVAMIHDPSPEVAKAVKQLGIEVGRLERRLEEFFEALPQHGDVPPDSIPATPRTRLVMQLADRLAREQNATELGEIHVFRAIEMEVDSMAGEILAMLGNHPTRKVEGGGSLLTTEDWRRLAKQKLDRRAYDYYYSGADAQKLKKRNRRAWDDIEIRHRVLVDVSSVDTSTEVLGTKLAIPAMIAPMAYQRLAHNDGELATARAAVETGVPMIVSTMANVTLEAVAEETPAPKWFQLYCHKDRKITEDLIRRAEAADYRAIVVTVDAPVLGRRLSDERNNFELPDGLTRANLVRYEESLQRRDGSHLSDLFSVRQDTALSWKDIEWFQSLTDLPILLKGVVRGDDARRAIDSGCAGVIVSNHGGRQLDASIPSARALPDVVEGVDGKGVVMVDGGVEWGHDIIRALALGADAVLIGRPVLWGLAAGGREGVNRVLKLYVDEFHRAMQLTGCATVADITPDLVTHKL